MSQLKLELRLESASKDEKVSSLFSTFNAIKVKIKNILPEIAKTFPHYSRHDIIHIESIIGKIEQILGDDRIELLSIGDVWLILMSVYLHDVGMFVSYQEEINAWKSDSFKGFLFSCENGNDKDLRKAAMVIKDSSGNIHPLLLKNYVIQLTAEYFRKSHAALSGEIVAGNSPISKLLSVEIPDNLQNIWKCVSIIVQSHGQEFDSLFTNENLEYKNFPVAGYGYYHPLFVAVLLRIGDLCDVERGRFNEMSIYQFGLLPEKSAQHYYQNKTMDDPRIDHEQIKMTARIKFDDIKNELPTEQYVTETDKENFCANIVHLHVNWFSMIKNEIENISRCKDSIFPEEISMLKDVPVFSPKIILNDEELHFSLEDLRFNFSREKAYELIEGYSLYDDPLTYVRELIQNSLDALKLQLWEDIKEKNSYQASLIQPDKKGNLSALMPFDFTDNNKLYSYYKINISVKYDREKKRATIIFADNGIGISKYDFNNKIIQTGASWQGDKYQKMLASMPSWLRPTGSFGIGLHSVFAVADSFRIETRTKDEANVIVLNSRRSSGFVFCRPEPYTGIKEEGTRVIIEVDVDRINDKITYTSPYENHSTNPVLDTLRKYIEENVICPLFDIYLYDEIPLLNKSNNKEPVVPKLYDHEIYGKLFNANKRNRLHDGSVLSDEYTDKNYDIAIANLRPLNFVIWDRDQFAFYAFEPELIGKYNSLLFYNKPTNKKITYMGIALRDQEEKYLYAISQLHLISVEFLAGNGKDDIIASRNRLKKEKLHKLYQQLQNSVKAAALFGQAMFSAVMQTKVINDLMVSAKHSANKLADNPNDVSCVFNDLKSISSLQKPTALEQLLYIVLVIRTYIKRNKNILWNIISSIFSKLSPFNKNMKTMNEQFSQFWYHDQFLIRLTKLFMLISYEFNKLFNEHYSFSFAYGFGYGFIREIGRIFEYESHYKLNAIRLNINNLDLIDEESFKDIFSKIGADFIDLFCQGLSSGFSVNQSVFGRAFLDICSEWVNTDLKHIGVLGKGFLDSIEKVNQINYNIKKHNSELAVLELINKWLNNLLYKNELTDSSLSLLSNDNWAWVLWTSKESELPFDNFLYNTIDYFELIPDFKHGYYFDRCYTIYDICKSEILTCELKNLTYELHDKLPFLWDLRWEKIELREQEIYVRLTSNIQGDYIPIMADNNVIQKWWKVINWNLHPGFTKYADVTIPYSKINFMGDNNDDIGVKFPINNSVLILPIKVENTPRKQFVMKSPSIKAAIDGIMKCEQVTNIIDHIYLYRLQNGDNCSKEEIRSKYKVLITDYVNAL